MIKLQLNFPILLLTFNRSKQVMKVGDKVFGHVKGYPPWPAVITSEIGGNRLVLYSFMLLYN